MSGPGFRELQYAFAAHLRDPARNAAPAGLDDRRLAVYRELFYNNVEGLLASNFPVIRRITPDVRWHALVRAFYASHPSHTPLFTEIGREFVRFLESRELRAGMTRAEAGASMEAGMPAVRAGMTSVGAIDGAVPDAVDDPPFLRELAHYEWVELAVSIDESAADDVPHVAEGDVVSGVPVVSPLAWPLVYRYPVHRIREDYQPAEAPAQPTCLVVVRNRRDEVAFMEVSPLTIRLLEALQENPGATGLESVESLAAGVDAAHRDALVAAGAAMLRQLHERDVLLGTAPVAA